MNENGALPVELIDDRDTDKIIAFDAQAARVDRFFNAWSLQSWVSEGTFAEVMGAWIDASLECGLPLSKVKEVMRAALGKLGV